MQWMQYYLWHILVQNIDSEVYFGPEYDTGSIASIALHQEAISSADLEMLLLITGLSFCPIH